MMTLNVSVVPSWFNDILSLEKIPLEDTNSYNKLYIYAEQGKMTKEEVYGYMLANERIDLYFGEIFDDFYKISQGEENRCFLEKHQIGLDVFLNVLKDEEIEKSLWASEHSEKDSFFKSNPHLLDKEFYRPKVIQGDTLVLVGSKTKTFKNTRAFYNALIETVHTSIPFEHLKRTQLMKHYLRHAVDD